MLKYRKYYFYYLLIPTRLLSLVQLQGFSLLIQTGFEFNALVFPVQFEGFRLFIPTRFEFKARLISTGLGSKARVCQFRFELEF